MASSELGSIPTLNQLGLEIKNLFSDAVTGFQLDPSRDAATGALLSDEADRFRLWAVSLGLFVPGHGSLDYRVREAENIRSMAKRFLESLKIALEEVLEYFTPDTTETTQSLNDSAVYMSDSGSDDAWGGEDENSTSDMEALVEGVRDPIDRLYKLSILIRNPSSRFNSSKVLLHKQVDEETGIDLLEAFHDFDFNYIESVFLQYHKLKEREERENAGIQELEEESKTHEKSKSKPEKFEGSYLIRRLALANGHRRQQFSYWRKHRNKLAIHINNIDRNKTSDKLTSKSALDSMYQRDQATAEAQLMNSLSVTTATRLNIPQNIPINDSLSVVSVSNYAASSWQPGNEKLDFPPPPKHAPEKKFFECPYCFTLCPRTVLQTQAWKAHLIHDLRPYICTYPDCKTPNQLYDNRRHWLEHENSEHRRVLYCPGHPDQSFLSISDYNKHCINEHPSQDPSTEIDCNINTSLIFQSHESTLLVPDRSCPICLASIKTLEGLQKHIALHLERFAIFSLPRDISSDDDNSSNNEASHKGSRGLDFDEASLIITDVFLNSDDDNPEEEMVTSESIETTEERSKIPQINILNTSVDKSADEEELQKLNGTAIGAAFRALVENHVYKSLSSNPKHPLRAMKISELAAENSLGDSSSLELILRNNSAFKKIKEQDAMEDSWLLTDAAFEAGFENLRGFRRDDISGQHVLGIDENISDGNASQKREDNEETKEEELFWKSMNISNSISEDSNQESLNPQGEEVEVEDDTDSEIYSRSSVGPRSKNLANREDSVQNLVPLQQGNLDESHRATSPGAAASEIGNKARTITTIDPASSDDESNTEKTQGRIKQEVGLDYDASLVLELPNRTTSSELRCFCSCDQDDGFMIQCDKCLHWQHGACVKISPKSVPDTFICYYCDIRDLTHHDIANARAIQVKRIQKEIKGMSANRGQDKNSPLAPIPPGLPDRVDANKPETAISQLKEQIIDSLMARLLSDITDFKSGVHYSYSWQGEYTAQQRYEIIVQMSTFSCIAEAGLKFSDALRRAENFETKIFFNSSSKDVYMGKCKRIIHQIRLEKPIIIEDYIAKGEADILINDEDEQFIEGTQEIPTGFMESVDPDEELNLLNLDSDLDDDIKVRRDSEWGTRRDIYILSQLIASKKNRNRKSTPR